MLELYLYLKKYNHDKERICKNVSSEVREINQGNIEYNISQMNKNK